MEKLVSYVLAIILVAALWLFVMWGIWSLWCWVLPQVYSGGPDKLVAPGFWLFAAAWTLLGMLGRAVFGGSSK